MPEAPIYDGPDPVPPLNDYQDIYDAAQLLEKQAFFLAETPNAPGTVETMQEQLTYLMTTVATQSNEIARLHETIEYLPCPDGKQVFDDDTRQDTTASIEQCTSQSLCTCKAGYVLTTAGWTPAP